MRCDLACALSDRRVDGARVRIEPDRVAEVVKVLDPPRLRDEIQRGGGFPPCSLIGRLDVEFEGETVTTWFMADEEQARAAGHETPPNVLRAVEMLYGEAEKNLGVGRVRP